MVKIFPTKKKQIVILKTKAQLKLNCQVEEKLIDCRGYWSLWYTWVKVTAWRVDYTTKMVAVQKIRPRLQDYCGCMDCTGEQDGRNCSSDRDLCALGLVASQSSDSQKNPSQSRVDLRESSLVEIWDRSTDFQFNFGQQGCILDQELNW